MKKQLLIFAILIAGSQAFAQGFPSTSVTWPLPDGGKISGTTYFGFSGPSGSATNFENAGSQTWAMMDMNGDRRPDLVVTAQLQGGQVTCFSPGLDQYWKVYLSNSSGFSTSAINWTLPNGGYVANSNIYGFRTIEGVATSFDNVGSQSWSLKDMNGDLKPDLVITAQLQGGNVTCFSPGSGQYWRVFLNTGSGFSTQAINWNLPIGGKLSNGSTYGYNGSYGAAVTNDNTGSQSWALADMDGDKKPDLVVTAQLQGGQVSCFSPGQGQYWKVYLNSGNGFTTTASNWNLPNGGKLSGGNTYGFNDLGGVAVSGDNTGSQTWTVMDMNADDKPDLVVLAQLQGGDVTCFSPGSNQYWKIYSNNGTSFANTPANWNLPNGGKLTGGITYGYNSVGGVATSFDNTGSQSWAVTDMDGDYKPDLVITGQLQGGVVSCFSPGQGQYWRVFSSYGSGFNTVAVNCNLPNGGKLSGGSTYGYNTISGAAASNENTGSQSWFVTDMNGDAKADLVVTAQLQNSNVTSFSPASSQYWKIYYSDLVLGIDKNSKQTANIITYPNPSSGNFTVKGVDTDTIKIINELGQTVQSIDLNSENNFTANVSNLKTGVYFLSGKNSNTKLIVLN